MKKTYKKNQSLAKANKSLRLQLHQASKKTLSQKSKHEVVREIMSPFFTQTQIDCFCRPSWLRSRNWGDQDFELGMYCTHTLKIKILINFSNHLLQSAEY